MVMPTCLFIYGLIVTDTLSLIIDREVLGLDVLAKMPIWKGFIVCSTVRRLKNLFISVWRGRRNRRNIVADYIIGRKGRSVWGVESATVSRHFRTALESPTIVLVTEISKGVGHFAIVGGIGLFFWTTVFVVLFCYGFCYAILDWSILLLNIQ